MRQPASLPAGAHLQAIINPIIFINKTMGRCIDGTLKVRSLQRLSMVATNKLWALKKAGNYWGIQS